MKRTIVGVLFFSAVAQVSALTISEIMYDPQGTNAGRGWIEIYNDTASAVTVTGWKFFEAGVNHGITAYQGGSSLPANMYAVIADSPIKFLADYPSYQGILFDSSFTLAVAGEALSLKETTTSAPAYTVDYTGYVSLGGDNDGSTLAFVASSWVRGKATPGAENVAEEKTTNEPSATTTATQATIAQMSPPSADIVLYMPFEKTVVAGAETEFSTNGMTRAGKAIDGLTCTWAFGDGGRGTGASTTYRYAYAGRYIAQVEGTNGYVAGIGRMMVRVVPPDITITNVATGKYGTYIDIRNPNAYDIDVSQWRLSIDGAGFPFPKNTLLIRDSVTHISGLAMGFASTTVSTSTSVRILFPNQEEVTRYAAPEGSVLGTATSSIKVNQSPAIPAYKPTVAKIVSRIAPPIVASSSEHAVLTRKDTRIVAFFRSLFGIR